MQDYRKDEIIYDEDWQSFAEPLKAEAVKNEPDTESEIPRVEKTKKVKKPISLITIQLVLCLLLAFLFFILKSMDSETYDKLSDWYHQQMRSTLVSSKKFEDIDLSRYFEATPDEIVSTDDEI